MTLVRRVPRIDTRFDLIAVVRLYRQKNPFIPRRSQSTPDSPLEDWPPCTVATPDFGPAPTTKRPRGVELDFDEGNLTKASRMEPQIDDEMDLDCGMIYNQVADSGFIHSLSLV